MPDDRIDRKVRNYVCEIVSIELQKDTVGITRDFSTMFRGEADESFEFGYSP